MIEWAQSRTFPFADVPSLSRMETAWQFSADRLRDLRAALNIAPLPVAAVAISGSLNRMEGHAGSDIDLLVVLDDRHEDISAATRQQTYAVVWEQLHHSADLPDLTRPKTGGVFSECASWKAMTDLKSRGVVDEDLTVFGQRMQLLVDAQPVAGDAAFVNLRSDLLNWYTETRVSGEFQESPLHWLWQDVQRYWRSLRSRSSWLFADDPRKSLEVNLKLRSSRFVLIAGFLLSLAETRRENLPLAQTIARLETPLTRTPLERLADSLSSVESRVDLLQSYQQLWSTIADLPLDAARVSQSSLAAMRTLQNCVEQATHGSLYPGDWLF